MATPTGNWSWVLLAGPPSPVRFAPSPPAMERRLLPAASTMKTMPHPGSAMYTLPELSTATPCGVSSPTCVGTPPPHLLSPVLSPAKACITPTVSILRTTQLPASTTYTFPDRSTATPDGPEICAEVAMPLSPEYPVPPLPASVDKTWWVLPGGGGPDPRMVRAAWRMALVLAMQFAWSPVAHSRGLLKPGHCSSFPKYPGKNSMPSTSWFAASCACSVSV